ncbi:MAG: protein kinase [Deltaproteobacteria bacterium]|nr:protein kinase [Deltaproteobacteria bacterium]
MSEDRLTSGAKIGRFVLERKLGTGGFGSVWRARDSGAHAFSAPVALKILHERLAESPGILERFTREAALLSRLDHPNVARPFAFSAEGPHPYLAMELVDGIPLDQVIRECARTSAPLVSSEVVRIFDELCSTISYAHSLGIVHRDLKPQNVMLVRRDDQVFVKVLDFGIAKLLEEGREGSTTVGRKVGSVFYMSPEQALGEPATPKSDQFALGVILYEVTTLRRPWILDVDGQPASAYSPKVRQSDNTMTKAFERITSAPRPKPSAVRTDAPRELDEVVAKATAIGPEERYSGAKELAKAARVPLLRVRSARALSIVQLSPIESTQAGDFVLEELEASAASEGTRAFMPPTKTNMPVEPTHSAVEAPRSVEGAEEPTKTVTDASSGASSSSDRELVKGVEASDDRGEAPREPSELLSLLEVARAQGPRSGASNPSLLARGGTVEARKSGPPWWLAAAFGAVAVGGVVFVTLRSTRAPRPAQVTEAPPAVTVAEARRPVATSSAGHPAVPRPSPAPLAAQPTRTEARSRPSETAGSKSRAKSTADHDLAAARNLLTRLERAPNDEEAASLLARHLEGLATRIPETEREMFTKKVRVSLGLGDIAGFAEALRTLEQHKP